MPTDNEERQIPNQIPCPNCKARLLLSRAERMRKLALCPECNTVLDLSGKDGSPNLLATNQPTIFLASTGKRFANYLIDTFLAVFANLFAIGTIAGLFEMVTGSAESSILLLGSIIFPFTYYFGSELSLPKSPAKFITKTRVVMEDGSKPDVKAILIRSVVRFEPFDPLSGIFSDDGWWHDQWSKTMVVDD